MIAFKLFKFLLCENFFIFLYKIHSNLILELPCQIDKLTLNAFGKINNFIKKF